MLLSSTFSGAVAGKRVGHPCAGTWLCSPGPLRPFPDSWSRPDAVRGDPDLRKRRIELSGFLVAIAVSITCLFAVILWAQAGRFETKGTGDRPQSKSSSFRSPNRPMPFKLIASAHAVARRRKDDRAGPRHSLAALGFLSTSAERATALPMRGGICGGGR
jgi:hypothetical protein